MDARMYVPVRWVHLNTAPRAPTRRSFPFYMLLETSGSEEEHDLAKLEELLEKSVDDGVVVDGAIAQDLAQGKGGREEAGPRGTPLAFPPFHLKPAPRN